MLNKRGWKSKLMTELGEGSGTSVIGVSVAGVAVIICTQHNDGVTALLKASAESDVSTEWLVHPSKQKK
jgi:hypothetical protein